MSRLETNVFPISNLRDLKAGYRLYAIRGLAVDQDEYDHNVQVLIGKLSRQLRAPVTVVTRENNPYLVVPEDAVAKLPSPFQLIRATAHFDPTGEALILDYENPTLDSEQICLRFLQFALEGALHGNPRFWHPSAGHPFFERDPIFEKDGINVYQGYVVRVVHADDGKFDVCVDVTYKYTSLDPLPMTVSREGFRRYRGIRCIYHYGLDWYEIRLQDHAGLNVKEQMIENGTAGPISVYDWIMQKARKPFPKNVAGLSPESSAVRYFTEQGEPRYAASALCYPVYDTSDPRIQRIHKQTILVPHKRRPLILGFVKTFLSEIRSDKMILRVKPTSLSVSKNLIPPPDLAFGNNVILSVRGTPGTVGVSLDQLGQERISALCNPKIGPHAKKPLDMQYIVIPQSVADSYGQAFLDDLKEAVNQLYPQETPYDPVIIPYNDRIPKTFTAQGKSILDTIDAARLRPGYGIVMIHEIDRKKREHDQLAAMLMHKLRKLGLYVTIIHTTVAHESYSLVQNGRSGPAYQAIKERRGRLRGYLRNVALNKVLIPNERWPFVLATDLNADLTVAIDVQKNTACFTFMGKSGPDIRTQITTSTEREKLSRAHVKKVILKILREDPLLSMKDIKNIVIQRDGRLFSSERFGIIEAVDTLKKERRLAAAADLNFVEIHKNSAASLRLFDVDRHPGGGDFVQNPQVGSYIILNNMDGYVCSTGREFNHPGTAKPLHVRYVAGSMPFKQILEDVYAQTCLALTRPEDCSRIPFTLKITDIRLSEHAGVYDEDALAFSDEYPENIEPYVDKEVKVS